MTLNVNGLNIIIKIQRWNKSNKIPIQRQRQSKTKKILCAPYKRHKVNISI